MKATHACVLMLLLVLALASGALGGCSSRAADVRATIEEYNALLPAAYSRSEPELLAGLVSDAEQNRVLMYVLYLRQSGEILDSRLLSLEFTSITFEDDRATAKTVESWEYRMLDAESRAAKGDWAPIVYESEYTLERSDDGWVIIGLDVTERPAEDVTSP